MSLSAFRIDVLLAYKKHLVALEPGTPESPMPQKMGLAVKKIDPEVISLPNGSALLSDWSHPETPVQVATFRISFRVMGRRPIVEIVEEHSSTIISVIDYIEFSMHQPLGIFGLEVLDVSPELELDQQREFYAYAEGGTAVGGRLLMTPKDMRWDFHGEEDITLEGYQEVEIKVATARWWYLKANAAQLAVDRYLALWTAAEILSRLNGVSVREPIRLPCEHSLPLCPQCNKATDRPINGPTMKKFIQDCGVDLSTAQEMWKLRQAVHGKNLFKHADSRRLSVNVGILQTLVLAQLKAHLGHSVDTPPIIASVGGPVIEALATSGTRPIAQEDITLDNLHRSIS